MSRRPPSTRLVTRNVALETAAPDDPSRPEPVVSVAGGPPGVAFESVALECVASDFRAGPPPSITLVAPPAFSPTGPRIDRAILDRLRAEIEPIERPWARPDAAPSDRPSITRERSQPWTFGLEALDASLGGLEPSGLHEVRPESHQDWGATFGVVLGLAVRRILSHPDPAAKVLWCATTAAMGELGLPYAPGLLEHGLSPERLLMVEAGHENDVLWAAEEGMRSGAPALVIAIARELRLTPARRLSLAGGASGVPCLALSFPGAAGSGAALTRWQVGRLPSRPRRLGDRRTAGPGIAGMRLLLERSRQPPSSRPGTRDQPAGMGLPAPLFVEWCHATHRFRLAAPLPDRASEAHPARRHRR